jgi:hypothetical protein
MQPKLNSEYVSEIGTEGVSVSTGAQFKTDAKVSLGAELTRMPEAISSEQYGFQPEQYGLGKPRRIIIRGKVAIG